MCLLLCVRVCVCVFVHVHVRADVRVCVLARARAHACECVCGGVCTRNHLRGVFPIQPGEAEERGFPAGLPACPRALAQPD